MGSTAAYAVPAASQAPQLAYISVLASSTPVLQSPSTPSTAAQPQPAAVVAAATVVPQQKVVPWWRAWLTPLCSVACLVAVLSVLAPIASTYSRDKTPRPFSIAWDVEGDQKWSQAPPGWLTQAYHHSDTGPEFAGSDAVGVGCTFSSLDSIWQRTAGMACQVLFFGRYAHATFINHARIPKDEELVIQVNGQYVRLKDLDIPPSLNFTMNLGAQGPSGSLLYPTHKLAFVLYVGVWLEALNENATRRVPLIFQLTYGFNPLVDVNPVLLEPITLRDTVVVITGEVAMDAPTVGLLKLLQVVMWIVTVATLVASFAWCWSPSARTTRMPGEGHGSFDLLSFSGALLFALPTMRQLWPLAPSGGTLFDILGIYAQLVCISIAICAQLIRRIMYDWP